jgi:MFS superfamily sulfate permease-like transporter
MIIGVFLAIVITLFLFLNSSSKTRQIENIAEEKVNFDLDAMPVKNHIETCLKKTVEEGAWTIAARGGEINSRRYTTFKGEEIKIYDSADFSVEKIEQELKNYTDNKIIECINFDFFPNININFSGEINSSIRINKKTVTGDLIYPLILVSENSRAEIKDYNAVMNIRFNDLIEHAIDLMNKIKQATPENKFIFNEQSCLVYADNGLTNIYYKKDDTRVNNIIQISDYSTYERDYQKPFILQIAIEGEANAEGNGCMS